MVVLIVKGLVNNSDAGSFVNGDSDHTGYVVQMPLGKTLCPVQRVYPNDHVVLVKFVWELVEVVVGIGGRLAVEGFHFAQVLSVALFAEFVVFEEEFLGNVVLVDLIRLDVGLECQIVLAVFVVVLLTYT